MLKPEITFCNIIVVKVNYVWYLLKLELVPPGCDDCGVNGVGYGICGVRLSNSFSTPSPVLHSNVASSV